MDSSGFSIIIDPAELPLTFTQFTFYLTAVTDLSLPEFKGSALRGGFGAAFKKVCCAFKDRLYCRDCLLASTCAYAYIFETPQIGGVDAGITAQNLPHPFVIRPPLTREQKIKAGDTFSFGLVLFGKGIEFLPYFIYSFDELGKMGLGKGQGRYHLDRVDSDTDDNVYSSSTRKLLRNFIVHNFTGYFTRTDEIYRSINLEFLSPTRITDRSNLTNDLDFGLLMRNILRRGSLIARIHEGREWKLDYGALLTMADQIAINEKNLRWYDWERFSNRQKQRMNLRGFTGSIGYEGDIGPFLPFVKLGSMMHIGKNTSFGMGWYKITVPANAVSN